MSIRTKLQEREEQRSKATSGGGVNAGLPDGVTRYVRASELKDGKQFVILADPDSWYFYYTHEDGDFATRTQYVKKHTCLHSPKAAGEDFDKYAKKNGSVCISCKAGAKRKLYFMIPVYDFEYKTWRVLDMKEFHASNLIGDYDKLEKAAKKFNKSYTLVGDVVVIGKTSDGKSYSMQAGDNDGLDADIAEAAKLIGQPIDYAELANFRDIDDIRKILEEADGSKIDKSVLTGVTSSDPNAEAKPIDTNEPAPEVNF
jgi:hypothetical protein